MRSVLLVLLVPLALLALAWACAALWFDAASSPLTGGLYSGGLALVGLALLVRARPLGRALAGIVGLVICVLAWWLSLEPRNDRDWLPDVARVATAHFASDRVTIRNVRNFRYRSETDYDPRWEERTYDLSQIEGTDIYLCYWGSPWIAHTIMSWRFRDAPPLAISIETRKEQGEEYSAIRGFFRQFELYYVVADERDVVQLRTNHRGDDCYLYTLRTEVRTKRAVLEDYLQTIDRLARKPRWYNAATHNCTTTIRHHVQNVGAGNPWDWRILLNGKLDELGYSRGTIDTSLPFAELRARSYVNPIARAVGDVPDFSARIREGLNAGR